jgi:AsmA-like C-terminal region
MVKKILKWTGITLLVLIIALFTIPFLFKDKIKAMVLEAVNEQVDAKVDVGDVSLSLFKHFPKASVSIEKLSVINKAPFEGDTLFYMGEINLKMSVKELFKGDNEAMELESFSTKDGVVNILFDKDGKGNFDIAIKKAEEQKTKEEKESKPLALTIQEYKIENLKFHYYDERSKMNVLIDSLNHNGKGDFAANKLDLDTHTDATLTLDMDKVNYMRAVKLKLDAILGMDMDKSIYTFKENKAFINQMGLKFGGSVGLQEAGQQIDINFETLETSFKNFLALVPESYSGSLADVTTNGNFTVKGKANGLYSETTVPKFSIEFASNNASFQYKGLPKAVKNIYIDTKVINESGVLNDTYVNIDKFAFSIDQDVFDANAHIRNIVDNPLVDAKLKGTVNLGNVTKAYPVQLDTPLSGILKADVETKFDMNSVETGAYEKIQNNGSVSLSGFNYTPDGFKSPFVISQANVAFNPSRITLSKFDAKTGSSDIAITGSLDNFYGFVFKNQTLQGNFAMNSNKLVVQDFMAAETTTTATPAKTVTGGETKTTAKTTTTSSDAVKIPGFLDCTITANAKTVVYDNLNLTNVQGKMVIKDEAVSLQNVKTNIFGGAIGFAGNVSTKGKVPTFEMGLDLSSLDITQSFTQLDMLKSIAPIAGVIAGKINADVKLKGNLSATEMTPDLKSLTGSLMGALAGTSVNANESKLLSSLQSNLKFVDFSKINLNKNIKLSFADGKVKIEPFELKYQDVTVKIDGTHGFDQSMNYNLAFDVPAKYLGPEVTKLLATLKPADANNLSVPVNASLTGSFKSPKVTTDLKQSVTSLTKQIVQQQKAKYTEEAKNKGQEILGNLIGGNSNKAQTDTTKTSTTVPKGEEIKQQATDKAKDAVNNTVNSLFKKKDKKE